MLPVLAAWVGYGCPALFAQPTGSSWIGGKPQATIDLTTEQGVDLVKATWKYADAKIVSIKSPAIGRDLKPSGALTDTYDIDPKAGTADFDDSHWEPICPPQPGDRQGHGRLSFGWYRLAVTLPERVGGFDVRGANVVFEIVVDDYAEVWVDGALHSQQFGQAGGAFISGWNSPNRVVVARGVQPGHEISIAVFAMNGPISEPPGNFVWIRSATLDFYEPYNRAMSTAAVVERKDAGLEKILSTDAKIERTASGFAFTEGPLWLPGKGGSPGNLLFSDPNENTIYRLDDDGELFVFRPKSGYTGVDIGEYRQPGSNGLARDGEGRLAICQHGNRRIVRIENNGLITVLADQYQGKRLNSPNDLVFRSDGALCFTDPPFGLPKFADDPKKELDFSGVYFLKDGKLSLIDDQLSGPNGIAFSPDERFLYVGNWDDHQKSITRYQLDSDGKVVERMLFFDMTAAPGEDAIDGIKVDMLGNLYISGPGGLWILSPDGTHLGTLKPPEHPHNLCFGGDDGRTLFLTCQTGIYRMRTLVPGATTVPMNASAVTNVK
jgi:gluconolactonase